MHGDDGPKIQQTTGLLEKERFLDKAGKYENIRIFKNVVVIGAAFMLQFTAFHGTANLQSSINSDGSLGTYTLAAIYGALILSNIFLPVIVIRLEFICSFVYRALSIFALLSGSKLTEI